MLNNNFIKTALTCTALFFVAIAAPAATQAQSTDYQPFTFGLKGGLNLTTFFGDAVDNGEVLPLHDNVFLYNAGGFVNYRFSRHFSVQAEALYSKIGTKTNSPLTNTQTGTTEYQMTYIAVPVLFKYHFANQSDWTPNIYIGPQISYLLNGEADEVEIDDQLKDLTFGVAAGVGVDWNIASSPQSIVRTIGLDLRYTLRLTNVFDTPGSLDVRTGVLSTALTVGF